MQQECKYRNLIKAEWKREKTKKKGRREKAEVWKKKNGNTETNKTQTKTENMIETESQVGKCKRKTDH